MSANETRLIPTNIWEDQIERPEQVDEMIEKCREGIAFLRKRLANLRGLRKLSISVYGDPRESDGVRP